MFAFFTLIHLSSYVGFVVGLTNPQKVLIGSNRTRLKSCGVYACLWLVSLLLMAVTASLEKPEPVAQIETPAMEKAKPSEKPTPAPTVLKPKSKPETSNTDIAASVKKTGLDFSYEIPGRVQESDKTIVVTYIRDLKCGEGAPVDTARQEWQATFDLPSQKWTDKVRELKSCLTGISNQEWTDYHTTPSQFSVESTGNETLIRADTQELDGSVIVKDSLLVKYTKSAGE